jgi:dolichol-phosphate mannosyltransferase
MKMLSVVIPAHNEEGSIEETARSLYRALADAHIPHEIVVVNDHSEDATGTILDTLSREIPSIKHIKNTAAGGFGRAVTCGLNAFTGEYVAIFMADLSDDPNDLVRFYKVANDKGVDCVFGTRFTQGGTVHDYPFTKLLFNRLGNGIIAALFGIRYGDVTNAFKLYSKDTIAGLRPFLAPHFNLTVELPLKAIVRGYTYAVVPNTWRNRKHGVAKFKIKEMGSRYFFIIFYCLIERYFSRGDYRKTEIS